MVMQVGLVILFNNKILKKTREVHAYVVRLSTKGSILICIALKMTTTNDFATSLLVTGDIHFLYSCIKRQSNYIYKIRYKLITQ